MIKKVFAHRTTGVRRDVLHRRAVRGWGCHNDRVFHGAFFFELPHNTCDRRGFLTDGDVDTLDARTALVNDRVDGDGGLAGLAVADDQLALAAADRHHRVDGLESGLNGLRDGLARDHAGRDFLDRRRGLGIDRALAVNRVAQRVDDAPKQFAADRHLENAAGRLDRIAFGDVLVVTEDNGTHRILLEVQRHAEGVAGELEHFAIAGVGQSVDSNNAVGDRDNGADITCFGRYLEVLDAFLNQLADFRSFECHVVFLFTWSARWQGLRAWRAANHRLRHRRHG